MVAEDRVDGEANRPVLGLARSVDVRDTFPILCFFLCVQVAADSSKVVAGGRSRSRRRRFLEDGVSEVGAESPGRAGVAQAGGAVEEGVEEGRGVALSVDNTGAARRRLVFTIDCRMRLAGTELGYCPWPSWSFVAR